MKNFPPENTFYPIYWANNERQRFRGRPGFVLPASYFLPETAEKTASDGELHPNWITAILIGNLALAGFIAFVGHFSFLNVLLGQHLFLALLGLALLAGQMGQIGKLFLGIGAGPLVLAALTPMFWQYLMGP